MPGCAAVGCSNSSEKGFSMKRFPRDPIRRKEWAMNVKRFGWFPTDSSTLCEAHFEPRMWEKIREDGKKRLRLDAVPTIFPSIVSFEDIKPTKNIFDKPIASTSNDAMDVEVLSVEASHASLETSSNKTTPSILEASIVSGDTSSSEDPPAVFHTLKKEQLQLHEKLLKKKQSLIRKHKNELRSVNKKSKLLNKLSLTKKNPITALKKSSKNISTKLMKWSDERVIKALRLKFLCGGSGYEEILKQNLPVPSIRTLQRRLLNVKFDSGILDEVFNFLKIKIDTFSEYEKDCVLVLDEMAVTPGQTYDTSTTKYFECVTLPEDSGEATHVLVFMLAGINTRWKQVVAYYFTSNAVFGSVFKDIVFNLFRKANDIGLNIISITSDMEACNQAFWRTFNVNADRYRDINNFIQHPLNPSKKVYFIADVPHLFKNVKNMLLTNKTISVPKFIQDKYFLPTATISVQHIHELVKYQERFYFKLMPKLGEEDLLPLHYDKMRVSKATNITNHDVSSALKFVAKLDNKPEYLTTAWFVDQIEKWFYLLTSRSPVNAISKLNEDVYTDTIKFLTNFMEIVNCMEVGIEKIWKPSQTGMLISTKSVLDIQRELLNEKGYECVLTGHFAQDCLENVFSVLRSRQITANAVQVKNHLKLLCVSQFLKCPRNTSYDDDREFLREFIGMVDVGPKHQYDAGQLPENLSQTASLN